MGLVFHSSVLCLFFLARVAFAFLKDPFSCEFSGTIWTFEPDLVVAVPGYFATEQGLVHLHSGVNPALLHYWENASGVSAGCGARGDHVVLAHTHTFPISHILHSLLATFGGNFRDNQKGITWGSVYAGHRTIFAHISWRKE